MVDTAMAVKQYSLSHIQQRNYVIMVSLDVQGAFYAAWWPSILCNLQALNCPRNLHNLARSYFSKRVVILHTNTYRVEKSNDGIFSRILLWPRILERAIQRPTKHEILQSAQANSIRGRSCHPHLWEMQPEAEAYVNSDLAKTEKKNRHGTTK